MSTRGIKLILPVRRVGLLIALATLAGCTSVPRETVESIAAREPVLLSATSAFGMIYGDQNNPAAPTGLRVT